MKRLIYILFLFAIPLQAQVGGRIRHVVQEASYPDSADWHATFKVAFAAMDPKPLNAEAEVINTFVQTWDDSSYLARTDGIWITGGPYEGFANFNMLYPDSVITLVNSPTWTTDGYLADSANSRYINTNYQIFVDRDNFEENDGTLIAVVTNDTLSTIPAVGGTDGTDFTYVNPQYIDELAYARVNAQSSVGGDAGGSSLGIWSASRISSGSHQFYVNGDDYSFTDTDASTGYVNHDLLIGGRASDQISNFRVALTIIMDGTNAGENIGIASIITDLATGLGWTIE